VDQRVSVRPDLPLRLVGAGHGTSSGRTKGARQLRLEPETCAGRRSEAV